MDGQIIMVLITLKMNHTTQMRTRKINPQLNLEGFIIKVNLLNFCPLIPEFDLQISKFKHGMTSLRDMLLTLSIFYYRD